MKVANDAFKKEIIDLHAESQELIKAVRSYGLKPDVVPLPEMEQRVLLSLGLSSQSETNDDVKPDWPILGFASQSEDSKKPSSQSEDRENVTTSLTHLKGSGIKLRRFLL